MPRVQKRGGQLDRGLTALAQRRSSLLRSQGKGLLSAVVLSPKSEIDADQVVRTARDKGLLLVPSGRDKVRFLPPLTVTAAEVRVALSKFEETMVELETTGGNAR
jgi:acetylornithine/N-succinyldiaminopimelate aminotransferase